ncbi:MAG: ABC transporter substrate-binding protein [Betaproteobacteria bacterium]|nr:ABC transporter substrate-binding protein [Betaproteobacteria bacterium]MDE2003113.1 ABC transporter substrate-binding protein [Betaproteobacteria bacterium]MDE2209984.1 ABC transporter substrate-binding protein [Betaproteobacteria bacterium]MDE2358140.1 ABC transporter substrate-binding protein [Betaproteobacteria bacterium]
MGIIDRLRPATSLAGMVFALMVLGAGVAAAQEPIRIGSILSVTGPASFLGDPEQKTLEMYVERLNAAGGVIGRKLQLTIYDDGGDAEKARTFTKRLIEQDKVDVIVGGSTTGTTMAAIPLVEQAQIPFISLAGAVGIIEPVKKWVFKTPHTDRMACEKIFADMRERKLVKVALISGTGGFDKSMRAECLKVAGRYGIEIVADETYGAADSDMTAQLTKIKATPGLQAVLNAGFGQGPVIVTRNYRQLGITVPLYQSHGVASKQFIKLAGDAAEGVRLPAAALLVAELLPDTDPQKAVVVAYKRDYEARYKSDVSTFGGHAYDGLMLVVDAIKRAGSTDKAKVRDAIENTHGYIGTGGVVNLSATDHLGLDLSAFRMLEVKNGDWALVK